MIPGHRFRSSDRRRPALALLVALTLVGTALGPAASVADAMALPRCRVGDKTTKFHARADWARSILDTTYRLPRTYRPVGMVASSRAGLSGGGTIRRVALADLRAMVKASRAAGARLAVESAYRSYATQVATFARWVHDGGTEQALATSARPGHSEHQLGTTLDFKAVGGRSPWRYADWGKTREGTWLRRNAWRFGFVMSYPKGKKSVTCYAYEPWHFRYVGKDLAKQVHDSGKALRQVLWTLQTTPPPTPMPTPTPTSTPTRTPEPTSEPSPTDVAPEPTAEPTPTPTDTPEPTAEPTPTDTPEPTAEPSPTDDAPAP
jgi:zinc D-Ala-D-Ala carboxypeptidase